MSWICSKSSHHLKTGIYPMIHQINYSPFSCKCVNKWWICAVAKDKTVMQCVVKDGNHLKSYRHLNMWQNLTWRNTSVSFLVLSFIFIHILINFVSQFSFSLLYLKCVGGYSSTHHLTHRVEKNKKWIGSKVEVTWTASRHRVHYSNGVRFVPFWKEFSEK